jgi:hypothetical protein
MKYKFLWLCAIILFFSSENNIAQEIDSIEVYLIDAYITPDLPHNFFLTFFTSDYCKSKVIIEEEYEFEVSNEFTDNHKTRIEIEEMDFDNKRVLFVIETEDSLGNKFLSDNFDFVLPYEPELKPGSNLLTLCLFGGMVFLLPSPVFVFDGSENYFSLTKEIPIISFRSRSYFYPASYISLEYSHIFNAPRRNYLHAGYKQLFEVAHIEYLSPGVSLYTNFLGNNGVSPEFSFGLFTIKDSFTLYARYRYNIDLSENSYNFSEISIGLYSGFFSLYLN